MGAPAWASEARFATVLGRWQHRQELDTHLSQWTATYEAQELMRLLQSHGVPAGAVLKGGETLVDPHLTARGFWDVVNHPEAGTYTQVSAPWRLSKSPRRPTTPSPSLGEHNSYVLGDLLGLSQQEIAALETQGIIGTRPIGAEEE